MINVHHYFKNSSNYEIQPLDLLQDRWDFRGERGTQEMNLSVWGRRQQDTEQGTYRMEEK